MRLILCFFSLFLLTSCFVLKVYPADNKKGAASKAPRTAHHMIRSGEVMELKDGPAEILFYGADMSPKKILFAQDSLSYETISKVHSEDVPHSDGIHQRQILTGDHDISKMLFIVDGEQMSEGFDLDSIQPEAIKSIEIINGDRAVTLFGEKAKKGVVVITRGRH